jgi:hypothetical protein
MITLPVLIEKKVAVEDAMAPVTPATTIPSLEI